MRERMGPPKYWRRMWYDVRWKKKRQLGACVVIFENQKWHVHGPAMATTAKGKERCKRGKNSW